MVPAFHILLRPSPFSMTKYTTLRGTVQTTRPMKDIPVEERRQILLELETMRSRVVREKHNINALVISHLRWHCQHLLKDVRTNQKRVRELRAEGLNSLEVATELNIPIEKVNKLW